jgi:dihydroneopterin aldolase
VGKRLIAFIEQSEFFLVESMAEEVARIVLEDFSVPWLKLRVSKLGALRGSKDVGILIERGTKPSKVTD